IAYTKKPAHAMLWRKLHQARRRHLRRSSFSRGTSGNGRNRRLRATAGKVSSKRPEEHLDRSAPASANPTTIRSFVVGERHSLAISQIVRTQNRVMTTSVTTNGPNVRNAGVVA